MKKKLYIRIWIVLAVVLMVSFSDWSFAADESSPLKDFAYIMNFLTQVLSWIRVVFAKFAWEFLTNKRVYGEILWLDALLWRYRVVVRNLANIWLWLFFAYIIFMALFRKSDVTKKIKDTLLRLFIAWLWIQTSRFLISVVMDMSTITLVAAWSVPAQVMSENPELETSFRAPFAWYIKDNMVVSWSEILLFSSEGQANGFLGEVRLPIVNEHQITTEQFMDDLLPKYDDVSGPLYYMWIAILDSFSAGEIPTKDTGKEWWEETIIKVIINGWATIVYSIEMMILCVVALLRVFYLWMFIALSPFVILCYCIKKADPEGWWKMIDKTLDTFTKNLNIKSFLINAFKPAIIVLWIWVTVILVAKIKWVMSTEEPIDYPWVVVTSHCQQKKECYTHIDSPLFWWSFKNLSKTFMDIILSVITIILIYQIIKISVSIGGWDDFVSKKIGWLQEGISDIITKTPIVPVPWYDKKWLPSMNYVSMGKAFWLWGNQSIMEDRIDKITKSFKDKTSDQVDDVMKARWLLDDNALTEREKSDIRYAWNGQPWFKSLSAKRDKINGLEKSKWMTLDKNPHDGGFWKEEFGAWLTSQKGGIKDYTWIKSVHRDAWDAMVATWNSDDNKNLTLDQKYEKIFNNNPKAVAAYADFFGLWAIKDWSKLKTMDISQWSASWQSAWWTSTWDWWSSWNWWWTPWTSSGSWWTSAGNLQETLSAADFSSAFAWKDNIQQDAWSNNCYLVAAVNLIARNPRFENLMKSSVKKEWNNYKIKLPLWEPNWIEYTVTPAELKLATIKWWWDGYRVMEIGYVKRMTNKSQITSADIRNMDGWSTIAALQNFLWWEGFEWSVITSWWDGSQPLSKLTDKNGVINNLLNYSVWNWTMTLSASSLPWSDTNSYKIWSHTLYNGHAYPILSVSSQWNNITWITVLDPMNAWSRGKMTLTKDEFFDAFRSLDVGRYTSSFLNRTTDQSKMGTVDTRDRRGW